MSNRDLFSNPEDIFHWGIKGLIRNKKGEILLMEAILPGRLEWDLPGGRVHKGVSPLETLQREIEEETGIKQFINKGIFLTCLSKSRIPFDQCDVGLILTIYELWLVEEPDIVISDEHQQFAWQPPEVAATLLTEKFPAEFVEKIKKLTNQSL